MRFVQFLFFRHALEQELKNGIVDYESYLEKRNNYAEKMSDIGKSNLAEYVMHRKTIVDNR